MNHEGQILGSCRKCDECIKARKRSYTGRIMAEMRYAKVTHFVTFTYGGGYNNADAYVLDYADVQRLWKRWRKAGYQFRYLAVGEFGGKRQRAHWHALIFWETDPPPEIVLNERIDYDFWTHGAVQFELPRSGQAAAAYVMDYLDKDALMKAQLKYSKLPALGERYLLEYAAEHARNGMPIFGKGNVYTIPGNTNSKGELFYYPVERDREVYHKMILTWIAEFHRLHPDKTPKLSPELKDWVEENADAAFLTHVKTHHAYFATRALVEWEYRTDDYDDSLKAQSYDTLDFKAGLMLHRHQTGSRLLLLGKQGQVIWQKDVGRELQRRHQNAVKKLPPDALHPPKPPLSLGAYTPETGVSPPPILLSIVKALADDHKMQIRRAAFREWSDPQDRSS